MAAGVVAGIWRYPVKSMQGERIDADELTAMGLANDRSWGVVVDGNVLSAKREPMLLQGAAVLRDGQPVITLPDGSELVGTGEKTDAALSGWLGRQVRLAAAVHQWSPPPKARYDRPSRGSKCSSGSVRRRRR